MKLPVFNRVFFLILFVFLYLWVNPSKIWAEPISPDFYIQAKTQIDHARCMIETICHATNIEQTQLTAIQETVEQQYLHGSAFLDEISKQKIPITHEYKKLFETHLLFGSMLDSKWLAQSILDELKVNKVFVTKKSILNFFSKIRLSSPAQQNQTANKIYARLHAKLLEQGRLQGSVKSILKQASNLDFTLTDYLQNLKLWHWSKAEHEDRMIETIRLKLITAPRSLLDPVLDHASIFHQDLGTTKPLPVPITTLKNIQSKDFIGYLFTLLKSDRDSFLRKNLESLKITQLEDLIRASPVLALEPHDVEKIGSILKINQEKNLLIQNQKRTLQEAEDYFNLLSNQLRALKDKISDLVDQLEHLEYQMRRELKEEENFFRILTQTDSKKTLPFDDYKTLEQYISKYAVYMSEPKIKEIIKDLDSCSYWLSDAQSRYALNLVLALLKRVKVSDELIGWVNTRSHWAKTSDWRYLRDQLRSFTPTTIPRANPSDYNEIINKWESIENPEADKVRAKIQPLRLEQQELDQKLKKAKQDTQEQETALEKLILEYQKTFSKRLN